MPSGFLLVPAGRWLVFNAAMTRLTALLLLAPVALSAAESGPSPALDLARQLNGAFVEVAEKVSPAVVVVKVAHKPGARAQDEMENPLWDLIPREFKKQLQEEYDRGRPQLDEDATPGRPPVFDGQGSGVVISDQGYILTNYHVVEDAEKIRVRLRDGRAFDGVLHGFDAKSDMAVLKIAATNLTAARFADSDTVRVGEFAVAIGAPFELDYSVTVGHVSAKGRTDVIRSLGIHSQGATMDQDFIQTDASINPGNSGGPLVNLQGEVIGINTLIRGLHTGIGFAVPANLARAVSDQLIRDKKFTRLWLGVGIRGIREDEDARDMSLGVDDGVLVTELRPDGPASKSDLRSGDVILAVDGRKVATATQLRVEVRLKKAGQPVTLHVFRNGKKLPIMVVPEPWPDQQKSDEKPARRRQGNRDDAPKQ